MKLVVKDKPKVTYKEVKRKMKKLTLTQKNRIKEEKKDTREQKAKEKAEKQRISQRIKININIPTSKREQSNPFINPLNPLNPLNQSSRDLGTGVAQISLLNSINEQLKNKNKPSSINDMFKIPVKQSATQTEPLVNRVIETQTEPTQVKQREQSTQHQGTKPTQGTETETFYPEEENFNQGMQDINNELQQRLANARLPEQFSPKVETPIPIIREPSIPIITKPKDKSNENLIEQASENLRTPISFLEALKEKQKIIKPKSEEETLQMEEELRKGRPKSNMNEGRILTEGEVLENKLLKEAELEARRKANEEDNRKAEQKKEQEQIKKVEAEYKRKQKEINDTKALDNAYNILIQNVEDPEEIGKLREAYNNGFLKKADIRKKLIDLRTNEPKPKKVFLATEVDALFNKYK